MAHGQSHQGLAPDVVPRLVDAAAHFLTNCGIQKCELRHPKQVWDSPRRRAGAGDCQIAETLLRYPLRATDTATHHALPAHAAAARRPLAAGDREVVPLCGARNEAELLYREESRSSHNPIRGSSSTAA